MQTYDITRTTDIGQWTSNSLVKRILLEIPEKNSSFQFRSIQLTHPICFNLWLNAVVWTQRLNSLSRRKKIFCIRMSRAYKAELNERYTIDTYTLTRFKFRIKCRWPNKAIVNYAFASVTSFIAVRIESECISVTELAWCSMHTLTYT